MDVRLYDPRLGRFLEVDPVEAGSANDYDYCEGDPVNCYDLAGTFGMPKLPNPIKAVSNAVNTVKKAASSAVNTVKKGTSAAVSAAWENRDTLAGLAAIGVCAGSGGLGCGLAVAAALAVRSEMRIEQNGLRGSMRANVADSLFTAGTFGIGQFASSGAVSGLGAAQRLLAKASFAAPSAANFVGCHFGGGKPYCT